VSGRRPILQWCLEPACESGPDVAAYPVLLPPTLGEHVEQNVSLATSSGTRFLLRLVCATVLRRATVCAIVTGPAPRKHAPPQAVYPRRLMGVWGYYRATWSIPGRIFGAEASPRVAPAEGRCAGAGSWTRGNLAARHAACARVVEQSDKNGWQKLDEPQPGQVHPRLIGPAAVGARMSSGEPTWRRSLLGCRRAPGPCRSRS